MARPSSRSLASSATCLTEASGPSQGRGRAVAAGLVLRPMYRLARKPPRAMSITTALISTIPKGSSPVAIQFWSREMPAAAMPMRMAKVDRSFKSALIAGTLAGSNSSGIALFSDGPKKADCNPMVKTIANISGQLPVTRPAPPSIMAMISSPLAPIITVRLGNRSAHQPPWAEKRINGRANRIAAQPCS